MIKIRTFGKKFEIEEVLTEEINPTMEIGYKNITYTLSFGKKNVIISAIGDNADVCDSFIAQIIFGPLEENNVVIVEKPKETDILVRNEKF